jgi:hypothetical protein
VYDFLSYLHIVLLPKLEEVFFSAVREFEAYLLGVVHQPPGLGLEIPHRFLVDARVVVFGIGVCPPERRIPRDIVHAVEPRHLCNVRPAFEVEFQVFIAIEVVGFFEQE